MFFVIITCPVRYRLYLYLFIFKCRIVYGLSVASITILPLSDLVQEILLEEILTVSLDGIWLMFLLPCLTCVSIRYPGPRNICFILSIIFLVNSFDKIQKLFARLLFIGMCPYLVMLV